MKPRIILAGGSGFVGRSLTPQLVARGYEVVVLTRGTSSQISAARRVQWDARTLGEWAAAVDGAEAI
ncbi:MAG TPA: NAD-dependent epimerase/dehydratase family protein, partial [Chthoniobacterales bacterium]